MKILESFHYRKTVWEDQKLYLAQYGRRKVSETSFLLVDAKYFRHENVLNFKLHNTNKKMEIYTLAKIVRELHESVDFHEFDELFVEKQNKNKLRSIT